MPFALPIWLAPYLGPLLAKAAVAMPWFPAWATWKRAVRVGTYLAVLAAGIWVGAKTLAWWQGDLLTARQAQTRCDGTIAEAALKAREAAVIERERSVNARAAVVALDEDAIETLKQELDHARGTSAGGNAVALRGDDEWLRAWMARRR